MLPARQRRWRPKAGIEPRPSGLGKLAGTHPSQSRKLQLAPSWRVILWAALPAGRPAAGKIEASHCGAKSTWEGCYGQISSGPQRSKVYDLRLGTGIRRVFLLERLRYRQHHSRPTLTGRSQYHHPALLIFRHLLHAGAIRR